MPKSLSFFLTKQQILDRTKDVTRRLNCTLKPGELFWAVEKVQGLKKGEKHKRLALLRCLKNEAVALDGLTLTIADVAREGFPDLRPVEFVAMFRKHMKCAADAIVQRVEFEYVMRDWRRSADGRMTTAYYEILPDRAKPGKFMWRRRNRISWCAVESLQIGVLRDALENGHGGRQMGLHVLYERPACESDYGLCE